MDLQRRYADCPYADTCLVAQCLQRDGHCWDHLRVVELAGGETLFHPGSPAVDAYVLCRGRVKLLQSEGTRTLCLGIVGPGQLLGEEAFADGRYGTRAQAIEPSEAMLLEGSQLDRMLRCHPGFDLWLLETLSRRCKRLYEHDVDVRHRPTEERLVDLLAALADDYGDEIPLSQADLAEMLGVGRDTVHRCLHALARQGWIDVARRRIRLLATLPTST